MRNYLKNLIIPEGVTEIGDYAFAVNPDIESIIIPGSVKKIGRGAFSNSSGYKEGSNSKTAGRLKSVTISNGVTEIRSEAFANNRIREITIPESVEYISKTAFKDNGNFNKVTIHSSSMNVVGDSYGWDWGWFYDKNGKRPGVYEIKFVTRSNAFKLNYVDEVYFNGEVIGFRDRGKVETFATLAEKERIQAKMTNNNVALMRIRWVRNLSGDFTAGTFISQIDGNAASTYKLPVPVDEEFERDGAYEMYDWYQLKPGSHELEIRDAYSILDSKIMLLFQAGKAYHLVSKIVFGKIYFELVETSDFRGLKY
jgi:hypothetical protein